MNTEFHVGDRVRVGQVFMPEDRLYCATIEEIEPGGALCRLWDQDWKKETSTVMSYSDEYITMVEPFKERIKTVAFGRVPGGAR